MTVPTFVCPTCGRSSTHPRDVVERFCPACGFAEDNAAAATLARIEEERAKQIAACPDILDAVEQELAEGRKQQESKQ